MWENYLELEKGFRGKTMPIWGPEFRAPELNILGDAVVHTFVIPAVLLAVGKQRQNNPWKPTDQLTEHAE